MAPFASVKKDYFADFQSLEFINTPSTRPEEATGKPRARIKGPSNLQKLKL